MSGKIDPIKLLESVIGKNPEAFLYQPVYQVTESEVREFARLLAAPVVERQEPMEWPEYHYQGMGCGLEDRGITDRYEACRYGFDVAIDKCAELGELFASPPSTVAVVLPERMETDAEDGAFDRATKRGYNACLDKVKELNQ